MMPSSAEAVLHPTAHAVQMAAFRFRSPDLLLASISAAIQSICACKGSPGSIGLFSDGLVSGVLQPGSGVTLLAFFQSNAARRPVNRAAKAAITIEVVKKEAAFMGA